MSRVGTDDWSGVRSDRTLEEEYARSEQIRARQPGMPLSQQWPEPHPEEDRETCAKCQNVGRTERLVSAGAGAALAVAGLSRGGWRGLLLSALGGSLVYRGVTGRCQAYQALGINTAKHTAATAVPAGHGVKVEKSIIINESPDELYNFWRELEHLPCVMRHLKRVEVIDQRRSHWVAEGVLGKDVEWDAEIYNERENEMIAWRSLPGGDVDTAGSIHFKRLDYGRGTNVTVSMKYDPPGGKTGATIASLLGDSLEDKLSEDLRNLKRYMETGEVITNEGQPRGSCR